MSFLSSTIPTFSRTSRKHFFWREIQFSLTQWGLANFGIGLRGNHRLGMGLRIQMTSSLPWKSTTKALLTHCLVKKLGTLQKTRSMWQWHSGLLPCVHCFFSENDLSNWVSAKFPHILLVRLLIVFGHCLVRKIEKNWNVQTDQHWNKDLTSVARLVNRTMGYAQVEHDMVHLWKHVKSIGITRATWGDAMYSQSHTCTGIISEA